MNMNVSPCSPRLGALWKLLLPFGFLFFIAASIDGGVRAFHYVRLPFC